MYKYQKFTYLQTIYNDKVVNSLTFGTQSMDIVSTLRGGRQIMSTDPSSRRPGFYSRWGCMSFRFYFLMGFVFYGHALLWWILGIKARPLIWTSWISGCKLNKDKNYSIIENFKIRLSNKHTKYYCTSKLKDRKQIN